MPLASLIDFVGKLFPVADASEALRIAEKLREDKTPPRALFGDEADPSPWQADIFDPFTFHLTDSNGQEVKLTAPGMMLSNTCDAENRAQVFVAACLPAQNFARQGFYAEARLNKVNNLFFLPEVPSLGDRIIDLSVVHTVSSRHLRAALESGGKVRRARLSHLGYFFFLAKMTAHLLRPESKDVTRAAPSAEMPAALVP